MHMLLPILLIVFWMPLILSLQRRVRSERKWRQVAEDRCDEWKAMCIRSQELASGWRQDYFELKKQLQEA